ALTNGAGGTMYAGSVIDSTTVRVFRNTGDDNLPSTDFGGLPTTYGGTHTSLAPNGVNWTSNSDNRVQAAWVGTWANGTPVLGFVWDSAQNAGAGPPQPFVRGLLINAGNNTRIGNPDLWSAGWAWHVPALASNGRGHIAGPVWYGGGNQGYPKTAI